MELKFRSVRSAVFPSVRSNRTFMELKYQKGEGRRESAEF